MNADANKIQQINAMLAQARHHRYRLDEITKEFVALHGYEMSSPEASELRFVIVDGNDYEAALRYIVNMRCRRVAAEEQEAADQAEFLN